MSVTILTPAASRRLSSLHRLRRELGRFSLEGLTLTVDATAKTITRSAGSWLLDGVVVPMWLGFAGFANAGNNDVYNVNAATNRVLTLDDPDATLVDETGDGDESAFEPRQAEELAWALDSASQTVVELAGREFVLEAVRETLPGVQGTRLGLTRTPIVTVDALTHDGDEVDDYSIEDAEAGRLYRAGGWTWKPAEHDPGILNEARPGSGKYLWQVDTMAGYVTPDLEDLGASPAVVRNLPEPVESVALSIATLLDASRGRDPLIVQERIGDYSYALGSIATSDQLAEMRARLALWTRISTGLP